MEAATSSAAQFVEERHTASSGTSWTSRIVIAGAVSIIVGVLWDISWHRTIGRDTFWTPAHLAIYLGGLLGGLTAGWLVIRTTFFGTSADRAATVSLWKFHGPLGAWVSIWGSIAMLTSAPFDNWWHDAYGLDVKILSPPHSLLALGMWAIVLGAMLLVLREQNNSPAGVSAPGRGLFVFGAGILLAMAATFLIEESFPNQQHNARFYQMSAATYPFYLLGIARASKFRWSATFIALIYMLIVAGAVWVLPLFSGQPKLGPIYNPVDHFVPLPFPLLLIAPAFAIDFLRMWIGHDRGWVRDWLLVVLAAAAFTALFLACQWYFSGFMLSPASHNWFFAGDRHWGYVESPGAFRSRFWSELNPRRNVPFSTGALGWTFLCALISSRLALWLGSWMANIRR